MVVQPSKLRGLDPASREQLRQALAEEAFLKPDKISQRRLHLALNAIKDKLWTDWQTGNFTLHRQNVKGGVQNSLPKGYFADFVEKVVELTHQELAPRWQEQENVFSKRLAENTRSFLREDDAYNERLVPGARPSRMVNNQCVEEELYLYEPLYYWDDEQQRVMRDIIEQRLAQIGGTSALPKKSVLSSRDSSANSARHGKKSVQVLERQFSRRSTATVDEESDDDEEYEQMLDRQRLVEARKSQVQKEMMQGLFEKGQNAEMQTDLSDLEREKEKLRRQIEDAKAALAAAESKRKTQKDSQAVAVARTGVKSGQPRAGPMSAEIVHEDQVDADHLHAEHETRDPSMQPATNGQMSFSSHMSLSSSKTQSLAPPTEHSSETSRVQAQGLTQAAKDGSQPDYVEGAQVAKSLCVEQERASKERKRLQARAYELQQLIAQLEAAPHTQSYTGGQKQTKGDSGEADFVSQTSLAKNAARSGTSGMSAMSRGAVSGAEEQPDDVFNSVNTSTTRDDTFKSPDHSLNVSRNKVLQPPKVRGFFQRMHDEATNRMMRTAALREDHLVAQEDKFMDSMPSSLVDSMPSSDLSKSGSFARIAKASAPPPSPQLLAAHGSLGKRNKDRQDRRTAQKENTREHSKRPVEPVANTSAKRAESVPQRNVIATSKTGVTGASSRPVSRGTAGGNLHGSLSVPAETNTGGHALGKSNSKPSMSRPASRGNLAGDSRDKMLGSSQGNKIVKSKDIAALSRPLARGTPGNPVDTAARHPPSDEGQSGGRTVAMAMSNSRANAVVSRTFSREAAGDFGDEPHVGAGANAGAIATSNSRESVAQTQPCNLGDSVTGNSHVSAVAQAGANIDEIATETPTETVGTVLLSSTSNRLSGHFGAVCLGHSSRPSSSMTQASPKGTPGDTWDLGAALAGSGAPSRPLSRGTEGSFGDIMIDDSAVGAGGQAGAATRENSTANPEAAPSRPVSRGKQVPTSRGREVATRPSSKGKVAPSPSPAASVDSPTDEVDSNCFLSAGSSLVLNPPEELVNPVMVQDVARSLGARAAVRVAQSYGARAVGRVSHSHGAGAAGRVSWESDTVTKAFGTGSASPDKMQHSGSGETLGPPDHWGWSVLYTTKGPTGNL